MMNSKVPLLYKISKLILGPIFKWYYKPTIIGAHNIPKSGPVLIVGNHKHLFDQCLAILATHRGIHYMAKKEYFDNKKTLWFFKGTGCISVNRKEKDPNAVKLAIDVLDDNGAVGLFPEGTRNRTKELLLPFKFGAVSMAKKTDASLVPFAITGDYKFRSKNLKIRFGKPFKVEDMDLNSANELLYNKIKELLEKE